MDNNKKIEEIKGVVSTWKTILSEGGFPDIVSEEVEMVEWLIQQVENKKS